ncbi:MAG: multiprotein bridging factor aMBF1 [Nitrososphaeraceae archaeon]
MSSFCELCGISTSTLKRVIVDGSVFSVCFSCSKHGKPYQKEENNRKILNKQKESGKKITYTPPMARTPQRNTLNRSKNIGIFDDRILNDKFGQIIRNARMTKGFTQEQIANRIGEKVSLIKKIESGNLKPDDIVAKKIERSLGIILYNIIDDQEDE